MKICIKCNKEKSLSEFNKRPECKSCTNKQSAEYKKTKEGLITKIYGQQRHRSRKRNYELPNYTLPELRIWALTQEVFHRLHEDWVASGYQLMMIPSFDRLDDYKPYTLDNLQIMTWKENKAKGATDRKNGINNKRSKVVIQLTSSGGVIKEYYSANQASRETGIYQSAISLCCNGKRESAGGFLWRYAN